MVVAALVVILTIRPHNSHKRSLSTRRRFERLSLLLVSSAVASSTHIYTSTIGIVSPQENGEARYEVALFVFSRSSRPRRNTGRSGGPTEIAGVTARSSLQLRVLLSFRFSRTRTSTVPPGIALHASNGRSIPTFYVVESSRGDKFLSCMIYVAHVVGWSRTVHISPTVGQVS